MPDIELIVQTIRQHHMMRYCGVSVDRYAHDWMLNTQHSGIGADYCFQSYCEWVNNHA